MAIYVIYKLDGSIVKTVETPEFLAHKIPLGKNKRLLKVNRTPNDKKEFVKNEKLATIK